MGGRLMEFKEKKKHPKTSDGDLLNKTHVFSGIRVDDGECDDWHCTGHASFFVTCSCGYADDISGVSDTEDAILRHRLAVIEFQLGLSFKENDD